MVSYNIQVRIPQCETYKFLCHWYFVLEIKVGNSESQALNFDSWHICTILYFWFHVKSKCKEKFLNFYTVLAKPLSPLKLWGEQETCYVLFPKSLILTENSNSLLLFYNQFRFQKHIIVWNIVWKCTFLKIEIEYFSCRELHLAN